MEYRLQTLLMSLHFTLQNKKLTQLHSAKHYALRKPFKSKHSTLFALYQRRNVDAHAYRTVRPVQQNKTGGRYGTRKSLYAMPWPQYTNKMKTNKTHRGWEHLRLLRVAVWLYCAVASDDEPYSQRCDGLFNMQLYFLSNTNN